MSKVISIYNDWAFVETVLPSVSNTEYSFLLNAEQFRLSENLLISLECICSQWYLNLKSMSLMVDDPDHDNHVWDYGLPANGRIRLRTDSGTHLTMLIEETEHPFQVFRKYILNPGEIITIGTETGCQIQYRYSIEQGDGNFVSRKHCSLRYDGSETVLEDTSSNGTFVNNQRVEGTCCLKYGDCIRIFGLSIVYLGNMIAVNSPENCRILLTETKEEVLETLGIQGSKDGSSSKDRFYRAPRSMPRVRMEKITIDPPPNPKEMPKTPILMQIGPALTMTIPMLLGSGITVVAAQTGGSFMYTGIITAVASAAIGTFWAIMNVNFSKKQIVMEERKRFEKYGGYLAEKQDYIDHVYQECADAVRQKYTSSNCVVEYDRRNMNLWNRNFRHGDMLTYRVGTGNIPFPVDIEVPPDKFTMIEDSMADKPRKIKEKYEILRDVPVCVDLKSHSLTGVIGDVNSWAQVIKNLIAQIGGNNSYTDVKIVLLYDQSKLSNAKTWDFVRWMPHVWSEDKKVRYFATNKKEAREVFYSLSQILRIRRESENIQTRPYYILFILNKELLEGELIAKYIGNDSGQLGLSTVVVSEHYEELPNDCEFIIENNVEFSGIYATTDEQTIKTEVVFDQIDDESLMKFAKRLANIEVNETEKGGEIPNAISFFEMYDISKPQELNAGERWRKSKIQESMRALIGVKSGGAPCYLDVHEKYHGPHGLVAGTTGSGKSETLQTFLLSLAINYSPDDIGFFIIDYKGGGMANLFDGLPHMIGAISNLSGNQVKRAMVSIKAENRRRQRLFSDYGVNNINAYTMLYKNGDVKEPIPHMFIIIDEFAELKREEEGFMKELVSVAQVGRSLGVHLILATQKPAGTVDDNIWSNSKFRLCLRVQDKQDSVDMLHRADAAYLTQAGRGFLQVGNDELFELFQSGYSGAVYDETLSGKNLTVAQMIDATGKVDLAGNHFKIKHQEAFKRQWIGQICDIVGKALKRRQNGIGDILTEQEILTDIYDSLKEQGVEYEQSHYNDERLKSFLRLYQEVDETDIEKKVEQIIQMAEERRERLPEQKQKSQLEAVKEYLAEEAVRNHYTQKFQLWMPLLPDVLYLSEIAKQEELRINAKRDRWTLDAVIGKGDDPENQRQMPIRIDFAENGHHVICGTVSTGKSTFLQTAVYSLISKYSSDEVNLYLIDFSSKLLTVFEDAKQVGGIMTSDEEEEEKIAKFFTMLSRIMEERKQLLASSNFKDYVEHGDERIPAIIVVIDNYGGFREKTSEKYEDNIKQIAKEGLNYGVFLMVTAGGFNMSEMPSRLAENFRTAICLEMQDIYAYSDIMRTVHVPVFPESNKKGRGLIYYEKRIIEFQTALACEGEDNRRRNENIRAMIQKNNELDRGKGAKRIPTIPEKPEWQAYIREQEYAQLLKTPQLLPNGYDAETAAYSAVDLTSMLTYMITGTRRSGKSTYMKNLILASVDKGCRNYIVEFGESNFADLAQSIHAEYISNGDELYHFVADILRGEVVLRAEKKKSCLERHLDVEEFFAEMDEFAKINVFIPNMAAFVYEVYNKDSQAIFAKDFLELLTGEKGYHYNFYFYGEVQDEEIAELLGYRIFANFKENGRGIRFGGKYLSQKLFNFENISYKFQDSAVKAGIGVLPSDDKDAVLKQIVVPMNRG